MMKKTRREYYTFGLAMLFLAGLFALAAVFDTATGAVPSVEVGVVSVSPKGAVGGFIIPASCESGYEHYAGECTTPPTSSISQSKNSTVQGESFTVTYGRSGGGQADGCTLQRRPPGGSYSTIHTNSGGTSSISQSLVNPTGTWSYRARCSGPGGTGSWVSLNHTVTPKNPTFSISPSTINEGNSITLTWECFLSGSSSGGGPFPGPGQVFSTDGVVSGSKTISGPTVSGEHSYQVSCSNGGSAIKKVTIREPDVWIMANPSLIKEGETSTISWHAYGVNSCEVSGLGISDSAPPPDLEGGAMWDDSATTPPLETQTTYRIECETSVRTIVERTTVNVVPIFEEI